MKKILIPFFLLGGLLSASPVNVQFVNGNANSPYNVGPYTISINGSNTAAMCMDDFLEVSGGETWTANMTAGNSTNLSNTYLGSGDLGATTRTINSHVYTTGQVYTAEVYLFSQLIQPNADRTDIQQAAWDIMDVNSLKGETNTTVQGYITTAFSNLNFNTNYYSIVSATGTYNCSDPQEFIVSSTPEPASVALFGTGIFAAGLARFFRRRKAGVNA